MFATEKLSRLELGEASGRKWTMADLKLDTNISSASLLKFIGNLKSFLSSNPKIDDIRRMLTYLVFLKQEVIEKEGKFSRKSKIFDILEKYIHLECSDLKKSGNQDENQRKQKLHMLLEMVLSDVETERQRRLLIVMLVGKAAWKYNCDGDFTEKYMEGLLQSTKLLNDVETLWENENCTRSSFDVWNKPNLHCLRELDVFNHDPDDDTSDFESDSDNEDNQSEEMKLRRNLFGEEFCKNKRNGADFDLKQEDGMYSTPLAPKRKPKPFVPKQGSIKSPSAVGLAGGANPKRRNSQTLTKMQSPNTSDRHQISEVRTAKPAAKPKELRDIINLVDEPPKSLESSIEVQENVSEAVVEPIEVTHLIKDVAISLPSTTENKDKEDNVEIVKQLEIQNDKIQSTTVENVANSDKLELPVDQSNPKPDPHLTELVEKLSNRVNTVSSAPQPSQVENKDVEESNDDSCLEDSEAESLASARKKLKLDIDVDALSSNKSPPKVPGLVSPSKYPTAHTIAAILANSPKKGDSCESVSSLSDSNDSKPEQEIIKCRTKGEQKSYKSRKEDPIRSTTKDRDWREGYSDKEKTKSKSNYKNSSRTPAAVDCKTNIVKKTSKSPSLVAASSQEYDNAMKGLFMPDHIRKPSNAAGGSTPKSKSQESSPNLHAPKNDKQLIITHQPSKRNRERRNSDYQRSKPEQRRKVITVDLDEKTSHNDSVSPVCDINIDTISMSMAPEPEYEETLQRKPSTSKEYIPVDGVTKREEPRASAGTEVKKFVIKKGAVEEPFIGYPYSDAKNDKDQVENLKLPNDNSEPKDINNVVNWADVECADFEWVLEGTESDFTPKTYGIKMEPSSELSTDCHDRPLMSNQGEVTEPVSMESVLKGLEVLNNYGINNTEFSAMNSPYGSINMVNINTLKGHGLVMPSNILTTSHSVEATTQELLSVIEKSKIEQAYPQPSGAQGVDALRNSVDSSSIISGEQVVKMKAIKKKAVQKTAVQKPAVSSSTDKEKPRDSLNNSNNIEKFITRTYKKSPYKPRRKKNNEDEPVRPQTSQNQPEDEKKRREDALFNEVRDSEPPQTSQNQPENVAEKKRKEDALFNQVRDSKPPQTSQNKPEDEKKRKEDALFNQVRDTEPPPKPEPLFPKPNSAKKYDAEWINILEMNCRL